MLVVLSVLPWKGEASALELFVLTGPLFSAFPHVCCWDTAEPCSELRAAQQGVLNHSLLALSSWCHSFASFLYFPFLRGICRILPKIGLDFHFEASDVNPKYVSTYRKRYQSPKGGGVKLGVLAHRFAAARRMGCWWYGAWHGAAAATADGGARCRRPCLLPLLAVVSDKGRLVKRGSEEEVCFRHAVPKGSMLQWLTVFKNICCFMPSFFSRWLFGQDCEWDVV